MLLTAVATVRIGKSMELRILSWCLLGPR